MNPQPLTAEEWSPMDLLPPGRRGDLIAIAYIKRALKVCRMTAAERIEMLESLNCFADRNESGGSGFLTVAAVAAVEPACSVFARIVEEARKLDDPNDPLGKESYRMLVSREVFARLLALNRSLFEAVELCAPPKKKPA